ncbi:hypothetical protein [Brevifollis gellanilyticus]|uniref:Exo-alpha-sialidase n=1 Tax=Brevifollis gellanilyticus TaxID=748831 RepID=A0A512M3F8_9BACT|nr:hypothetical protein [Brevifollis gellanilyticus]GEP40851.1 hypothetical protein BGE01nite_01420 [Brevifollis gellanilyticus]
MKLAAIALFFLSLLQASQAQVKVESVPEGGIQPQVLVDAKGTVHLVYLKGDPKACDIRYTHRAVTDTTWANPITVNSIPGSAVAIGTIRGAQLALGRGNSVQVVWNGVPTKLSEKQQRSPLYHARKLADATTFEKQRDWLGDTVALDGGASVAANAEGRVCLVWHAAKEFGLREGARYVFVRDSSDDGATFSEPRELNSAQPGVCPCCSLKAHLDAQGALNVIYRAAMKPDERGMALIREAKGGKASITALDDWHIAMCPMSSISVQEITGHVQAAWENNGRLVTSMLDAPPNSGQTLGPPSAKHPSVITNKDGSTLLTCITGSGWMKPGRLHWELRDTSGKVIDSQDGDKLPVWSFATSYALPDGSFIILR